MDESDSDHTDETLDLEPSESEASDSSSNDSSSNDSSSASTSINKKEKGSLPRKPIAVIGQILKDIVNEDTAIINKKSIGGKSLKGEFFCIEDAFLTKDIKVHVEGMGQIAFPLEKESIDELIKLSSKAKFGKGKDTLLDTNVRDTQTIPASKLKVEINNSMLDDLLKRIGTGLNVGKNCQLIPHLHNLLIYGPGQFFKKHTDSEKVENMIATLVIILPYPHEGGELIISHNKKKHMVFGSKNPDVSKCVAFYSDCVHEIKTVTEGYRVAITYNIVLRPPDIPESTEAELSESLDIAVENYFSSGQRRLAFGLNHCYSRKSLRWDLLKGADRTRVNALVAVAKKQGRVPCLALTTYQEIYDKQFTMPWEKPALVVEETSINFMIDEKNAELNHTSEDNNINNYNEYCCTRKAKELFKPFETEFSGPTGNEGDTEEYWYRRACVVLWSSKWAYSQGFTEALSDLHQLTKQDGMQNVLMDKMNEVRKDLTQPKKWKQSCNAEMLLDIATYLNDEKEAKFILGDLCEYVMKENVNRLVQLEKMFSDQTWSDILKIWKEKGWGENYWRNLNALDFIDKYMELVNTPFKSVIVDAVLEEGVKKFIESQKYPSKENVYIYHRIREESITKLEKYMKICSTLGKKTLEESLIRLVTDSSYPAVSLGELYTKLMDDLQSELLTPYEEIRDLALKGINIRLSELKNETLWALHVKVSCKCKICVPVWSFLNSETQQKSNIIECPKKTYDHLNEKFCELLYSFALPLTCHRSRQGRKYLISFEKLPKLLEDEKKLNEDLVKFKNKIEGTKQLVFVDVKSETDDFQESSVGPSFLKEEFEIKPEPTTFADGNNPEQDVPKKRQRKQKMNP